LNDKGQLGIGSTATMNLPTAVLTNVALNSKKIKWISAGEKHVTALDIDGITYAWGDNANGQLGEDSLSTNDVNPGLVYATDYLVGQKIVMVSSGLRFSLALSEKGRVFGWGANSNGNSFIFLFFFKIFSFH